MTAESEKKGRSAAAGTITQFEEAKLTLTHTANTHFSLGPSVGTFAWDETYKGNR